jgi:hypothetical protein
MELREFKIWLIDNRLDDNELFNESIKCYQIEAYKAAYLYSYLGYMNYIKKVIIDFSGIPKKVRISYSKKMVSEIDKIWKKRLETLDSEDNWESETFNFIKQGMNTNIFQLKDNIRNEFITKKDLRNVCAHNKTRTITNTTVDDLWDFIKYSKPYFVVNGSLELWKERFMQIIKFTEVEKHEFELWQLSDEYKKWQVSERKSTFNWLLDQLDKAYESMDRNILECTNIFLEKVFDSNTNDEYEWIKDDKIVLYCKLNIDNYKYSINENNIHKYVYENIHHVIELMSTCNRDDKIRETLKLIYSNKNFDEWWKILKNLVDSNNGFKLDEDIMNIIVENNKIDEIFKKFQEKLYTYKTGYGNQYNTNTFDYCNFSCYREEIMILLILIKNGKVKGDEADDLVRRSKELLELKESNYSWMINYFEKENDIYDWLNV